MVLGDQNLSHQASIVSVVVAKPIPGPKYISCMCGDLIRYLLPLPILLLFICFLCVQMFCLLHDWCLQRPEEGIVPTETGVTGTVGHHVGAGN